MRTLKLLFTAVCFILFANSCIAEEYYCGDVTKNYDCANLYDSSMTAY